MADRPEPIVFKLTTGDSIIGLVNRDRLNDNEIKIAQPLVILQKRQNNTQYFLELERWLPFTDDPETTLRKDLIITHHNPILELEQYYYQSVEDLFLFSMEQYDEEVDLAKEEQMKVLRNYQATKDNMN